MPGCPRLVSVKLYREHKCKDNKVKVTADWHGHQTKMCKHWKDVGIVKRSKHKCPEHTKKASNRQQAAVKGALVIGLAPSTTITTQSLGTAVGQSGEQGEIIGVLQVHGATQGTAVSQAQLATGSSSTLLVQPVNAVVVHSTQANGPRKISRRNTVEMQANTTTTRATTSTAANMAGTTPKNNTATTTTPKAAVGTAPKPADTPKATSTARATNRPATLATNRPGTPATNKPATAPKATPAAHATNKPDANPAKIKNKAKAAKATATPAAAKASSLAPKKTSGHGLKKNNK